MAPMAEVRVDGWTIRETRPEKTFYDDSREASSRTPARMGSQWNFQDGRREFGQSDVQEGPAIERQSSLSWIPRIVRVFFYLWHLRENLPSRSAGTREVHQGRSKPDSIEDRPITERRVEHNARRQEGLEDVARVKRTPTPRGAKEKIAKAKRIKRRSAGQSRRQFGSADWSKMARKGRITKNNNNINYKKTRTERRKRNV